MSSVNSLANIDANEISAAPLPPGSGINDVAKEHKTLIAMMVTGLTPPVGLNAK